VANQSAARTQLTVLDDESPTAFVLLHYNRHLPAGGPARLQIAWLDNRAQTSRAREGEVAVLPSLTREAWIGAWGERANGNPLFTADVMRAAAAAV